VAFELLTLNNGHQWAIQHKASMFRSNLEAGLYLNDASARGYFRGVVSALRIKTPDHSLAGTLPYSIMTCKLKSV
jgi:hypothetical protein